ncbi:MAG TPA: HlyC/CorC family transporter [Gammaproteobacteria bacterium]|nr:HlyC/CorC family transporter [Gammaproteobacteria bacterium]HRA42936.1 HlyC/CorC family transporter [Gammaproteobacteria bacterium]
MNSIDLSDELLFSLLVFAVLLCAFCAASETGILSLNRFRLKHLVKTEPYARRITKLLQHPDRLLGVILIGSTFATAISASIANQIAEHFWGELGVIISPIIVTLFLLVFAEVMPKTVAALRPEQTSRFVSLPLQVMQWLLYPLVFAAAAISSTLLGLFGLKTSTKTTDAVTADELRTIVSEAGNFIPSNHQSMLLSILDLENVRVEHIMIPRNEVVGIDLDDDKNEIISKLKDLQHTLLPVYRSDLDNVQGILHTRNIVKILAQRELNEQGLLSVMEEPYFVPEGTSLHTQLLNFQKNKRRMGLIVDEYGDVLGLVTLEDILEEIVGQFTTEADTEIPEVQPQEDGTFLIDGGISVRDLNRLQQWELPTDGPTTLNGLIIERLEFIPPEGTCLLIAGHPIEVVQLKENTIKIAKISPKLMKEK